MLASSMISRSHLRGFSLFRLNPPLTKSISSMLWIVEAFLPVISVILLAARPVGAAIKIESVSFSEIFKIARVIVLLPVPGPPVMIWTFSWIDCAIAVFCSGANSNLSFSSTHSSAFSTLTCLKLPGAICSLFSSLEIPTSA